MDCLRLEKLKDILSDRPLQAQLLCLNELRMIKFSGILQGALYLLGYDKKDINIAGSNVLNWKYARTLLNEALLGKLVGYSHRGAKERPRFPWSMINRVQKRLEKFDQEQADNYNIGYGRLLKMLLMTCRLRRLDIEIRRSKLEQKRQMIQRLQEEVQRLSEEREKSLKAEQEQLSPEDLETFNQEEWDALWDMEHPAIEVPEQPMEDQDLDYEFELQQ